MRAAGSAHAHQTLEWAASQLAAYGVEVVMKSEKLKSILLCSKVLELAEVPFKVEASGEGGSPVGPPAVATELVQAEAPDMGDVSEL